jgi:ribosomal protein S18 acetylase RimI-like enzyme
MAFWEADMRRRGYDLVMTSTQSDEEAQHFYRKLGYRDCGSFELPFPGHEQPPELILAKATE